MKTKLRHRLHSPLLVLALGIAALAFQNCSPALKVAEDPERATFKSAEDCMSSTADACLFKKNAVSHSGKSVTLDKIGGYQSMAVSLTGLDGSGFLQNSHLVVTTSSTDRLKKVDGFRQWYDPKNSFLEQLMAYYYLNEAAQKMTDLGVFPLSGAAVTVVADSSFTGWLGARNELHLERNGRNFPAALDASVSLNLYTIANIWSASSGQSHSNLAGKSQSCNDSQGRAVPFGCCLNQNGCGPAVVSGAADYWTAVNLSGFSTAMADGWKNDPAGGRICGLARDPSRHPTLTASQAHQACSSRGAAGQAQSLGLVYASIWWEVRKQVSDKVEFDELFLRHWADIRGDDDFASIKNKVLIRDGNDFGGRYGGLLATEFSKRGL